LRTANPILHSPAVLPSGWAKSINASDADLTHLHWVNIEMMSVEDIGRIEKPVVWTLHDMWAFCGAEHVADDFRWREGYLRTNRPSHEAGFDLNKWVWGRKRRAWRRPMHIVAPSRWLAECVQQSMLMREWPVSVIPNAIDTDAWRPVEKTWARNLLGLPSSVPLLLFGTFGSNAAPHKGFDLFQAALQFLRAETEELQLVVFGERAPREPVDMGLPVHYMGHLHDDLSLRILYSAADVMIVPSRKEAFGQTASEALACGTPVIAFGATGLLDVVRHQETGYLAKAYDPEDFARGIQWVLEDRERYAKLSAQAREDAVGRFSYPAVARQYLTVYEAAQVR
jgi:glycosyltransferase involved in cell wall biosynthesis